MNLQYQRTTGEGKERYTAYLTNLEVDEDDHFELTKAKHFHGYGKHHVTDVYISNSTLYSVPRVGFHYTNLSTLSITNCGLTAIYDWDFSPLDGLNTLYLTDNLIESLPADLFDETPQLTHLSLKNNRIKFISKYTLTPLRSLKCADFRGNININEIYDSSATSTLNITLIMLQTKIFMQCKPPSEQVSTVTSYMHSLYSSALLFDFEIKAKEEVFKVHKAVLAANSPVFAAMFSHEMKENVKNEMTIENFHPESVKELLAFVYLREVPQTCHNATELYAMAQEYQIDELSKQIQWHISMGVNRENASKIFKFGVLYSDEIIKRAAFHAIEESLNRKLPAGLLESAEELMELLEVKDKLDDVLMRIDRKESERRLMGSIEF